MRRRRSQANLEEWRKLCFAPLVNTQVRRVTVVVEKVVEEGITKKVRISRYTMVKGRKCGAKYFCPIRDLRYGTEYFCFIRDLRY